MEEASKTLFSIIAKIKEEAEIYPLTKSSTLRDIILSRTTNVISPT